MGLLAIELAFECGGIPWSTIACHLSVPGAGNPTKTLDLR
jgi:hypothetical protein